MTDYKPTPSNGRPFYCIKCGLGFGEFMACELTDCKLESEEEALQRKRRYEDDKALEREIDRG